MNSLGKRGNANVKWTAHSAGPVQYPGTEYVGQYGTVISVQARPFQPHPSHEKN